MSINNFAISNKSTILAKVYGLLAATMIPTGVGAYLGMQMGFGGLGLMGFLAMFALMIGIGYVIRKAPPAIGVGALFIFTFVMGIMLSVGISLALGMQNGANIVVTAAAMTVGTFTITSLIGATTKSDLSGLSGFLTAGTIVLIIACIASFFFHTPLLVLAISGVAVILFSVYTIYDTNQIVNGGETNVIAATLNLYLNIINIFQSLLNILMILNGNSRD